MARISAILLSCHFHCVIIFYFRATATCATFFSACQWRGGAKSGASAQHSKVHLITFRAGIKEHLETLKRGYQSKTDNLKSRYQSIPETSRAGIKV